MPRSKFPLMFEMLRDSAICRRNLVCSSLTSEDFVVVFESAPAVMLRHSLVASDVPRFVNSS